jgi:hypothetical protein
MLWFFFFFERKDCAMVEYAGKRNIWLPSVKLIKPAMRWTSASLLYSWFRKAFFDSTIAIPGITWALTFQLDWMQVSVVATMKVVPTTAIR